MDVKTANISEIFSSIQGEGPYIGYRQVFVRFCGCNLSCEYCDTDHKQAKTLTVEELLSEIRRLNQIPRHSISLTGGEPLLQADFLAEFLKKSGNIKVYLETNATLPCELEKIVAYTDIIAMDIKISSSTGEKIPFDKHAGFIRVARSFNREIFAKVVFGENITGEEISAVKSLVKDDIPLILQPVDNKCPGDRIIHIHNEFLRHLRDVRVIPQVHKYMGLR